MIFAIILVRNLCLLNPDNLHLHFVLTYDRSKDFHTTFFLLCQWLYIKI